MPIKMINKTNQFSCSRFRDRSVVIFLPVFTTWMFTVQFVISSLYTWSPTVSLSVTDGATLTATVSSSVRICAVMFKLSHWGDCVVCVSRSIVVSDCVVMTRGVLSMDGDLKVS